MPAPPRDRKSTRLNSSHMSISYAFLCQLPPTYYPFPYTTLFRSRLVQEPVLTQLALRPLRLLEVVEPHGAEHDRSLGELDVAVIDNLEVVAPRVVEVERARCLHRHEIGRAHV